MSWDSLVSEHVTGW